MAGKEKENGVVGEASTGARASNFVRAIILEDLKTNKHEGRVTTRFPPEPNGYLHIGHAKAICLNFGLAKEFQGQCHLRFDDTNPEKEDMEYVASIKHDVSWLGFDWGENLFHASDYFEQLYGFAEGLIKEGKAYVCSHSEEEIRTYRGTVTEPGKPSPYRNRSVEENLDLFRRMRAGDFPDGLHVLRAKIDMASANMKMRDPLLYRIRHATHYRTGDDWCIYPMYDFAHCLSDAIEGISHSICTLEFENNRELYDWILDEAPGVPFRSHQYEFARLNLNYTIMSKRKLLQLVEGGYVDGWDDPRMPTIAGMRRRGYTPEAIRDFCDRIGVAKANSVVDIAQLEFSVRNDLNQGVPRVMCVLQPLRVVIENYPQDKVEDLDAAYYPHDIPREGSRLVPFSRELFIERDDFNEDPPKGFFRLAPGREVRLRHAYVIKCEQMIRDKQTGELTELRCTYDPDTRGVKPKGRKVKGTIHWVSAAQAVPVEVRLYDRLFLHERPDGDKNSDFKDHLNPKSLQVVSGLAEPSLAGDDPDSFYQFERLGFFRGDPVTSKKGALVFNRTVPLRDSWARTATPGTGRTTGKPVAPTKPAEISPIKPEQPVITKRLEGDAAIKFEQYLKQGLSEGDAVILAAEPDLAACFEDAVSVHNNPRAVANWIVNELVRELKGREMKTLPFGGAELGHLVSLIDDHTISSKIAKDVFTTMILEGGDPREIVDRKGLRQMTDVSELELIVDRLITENPDTVARFKGGKKNLLGFFVGQVMKQTQGKANPRLVNQLLQSKLS